MSDCRVPSHAGTSAFLAAAALALAAAAGAAPAPLDVGPLFAEVDTNHDGCVSAAEWFAARLPKSAYEMLKDAKGCVTVAAMHAIAPPPGIDLDGDGRLTAAEFREFDRRGAPARPAASSVSAP